jgi:hypothetical protein
MSIVLIRAALEAKLATVPPIVPALAFTVAVGNPAVFTTATPHGLVTGTPVTLPGYTGGTPALAGAYLVVVQSPTTFNLQNSATKAFIAVTIPGTAGSVLANLTAYQNAVFQSATGVPYQLIHMTTFKPDEPTQGGGYYREHGVFQVTLVYPVGVGIGAITARAELIRSFFKKGTTLVNGGITTVIPDTPEFGYLQGSSDDISLPVKIGFRADIYT